MNEQFGKAFVTTKVVVRFPDVDGKDVGQVEVSPAKEPMIVRMKDKNGQSVEKFYVRSGNSSQEITMSEMSAYVKDRIHS